MSDRNVFVSGTGRIMAVLDWEQVIAVPPLLLDPYPKMLLGTGVYAQDDTMKRTDHRGVGDERYNRWFWSNWGKKVMRFHYRMRLSELEPPHTLLQAYETLKKEYTKQGGDGEDYAYAYASRRNDATILALELLDAATCGYFEMLND